MLKSSVLIFLILLPQISFSKENNYISYEVRENILKIDNQFILDKNQCNKDHVGNTPANKACLNSASDKANKAFGKITEIKDRIDRLKKPDGKLLDKVCSDGAPDQISNCKSIAISKYYQDIALLRQGLEPQTYHAGGFKLNDGIKVGSKEDNLRKLQSQIDLNILKGLFYIYYDGMWWCEADWDEDCREDFVFQAPEGFQMCRKVRATEDKRKGSEIRWKRRAFKEDQGITSGAKRIKAYVADLHALGGPWHDRYSSSAKVSNLTFSVVSDTMKLQDRKNLGCEILQVSEQIEPSSPDPIVIGEICGLLTYKRKEDKWMVYEGTGLGSLTVNFSKNGKIVTRIDNTISKGNIFRYDTSKGSVSFTCK